MYVCMCTCICYAIHCVTLFIDLRHMQVTFFRFATKCICTRIQQNPEVCVCRYGTVLFLLFYGTNPQRVLIWLHPLRSTEEHLKHDTEPSLPLTSSAEFIGYLSSKTRSARCKIGDEANKTPKHTDHIRVSLQPSRNRC